MAKKAAKKSGKKASKKKASRKAYKAAAKKTAKKAARRPARKAAKKPAKKAARKTAKKAAARAAPIRAVVRSLDDRPDSELATELNRYGSDPHGDPDVVVTLESVRSLAAVAQWRVAKSLLKLRAQVNTKAPNRNKASDGTIGDTAHCGDPDSTSDHCPRIRDGGVGVVAGMDITHDPTHGCDAGKLAASIRDSRDARVKYVIWDRRIANSSAVHGSPAWAWRAYNGPNPHSHHVHISVKPSKPEYDSEANWTLPS